MGDDIGVWNIGATMRHDGGRTPTSTDGQGMLFTDYYAGELPAGRTNFIMGEHPFHFMTTVGQAGAKIGIRRKLPCAPRSKRGGYATGQFGKNHLDDLRAFCHRPRVRRILRLPLSPGRDGRPGASNCPQIC
jgi:arylsulfatase